MKSEMKLTRSSTTTSLDEYELMSDPKYRTYVQQIDKALKGFEYTSEWADLVNALGKLNKVLQNNNKFNVIPRRFTVGQRLAQCMHPALPSGVHLKALETYDLIFKCIGTDRLIQELSIYSNGLFPLLSHAAINVKPHLLAIYESHFVPLGQRLRPALDGFLIAVLPGLEEGADYHDRTDKLLYKVSEGVGHEYFYGSLWRCILNNPSVRLPATSYIILHFNKKKSLEEQLHMMGLNVHTLNTGICAALLDSNILVQRAILDLLICCFPMHNHQIVPSDMINITTAAITVLLRRDVSLNRRLCSWLFGLEAGSKSKTVALVHAKSHERRKTYFDTYSKELVLQAIKICLTNPSKIVPIPNAWSSLGDLWQYRLLICLLDHQEISSPLIDSLSIEVLRALYFEVKEIGKTKLNKSDLLRNANLLFTNIGINYLWQRLSNLFAQACEQYEKNEKVTKYKIRTLQFVEQVGTQGTTVLEVCSIVDFILDHISIENYPEISQIHLPLFLQHLLDCLINHCSYLSCNDFQFAIKLCLKIVHKISPLMNYDRRKYFEQLNQEDKHVKTMNNTAINECEEDQNSQNKITSPITAIIHAIHTFFSVFVRKKLVLNEASLNNCFSTLCVLSTGSERELIFDIQQPNLEVDKELIDVYSNLCQLLVEVSTISMNLESANERLSLSSCLDLPSWLQYILVLSVYTYDFPKISYLSISTILDLITITKALIYDIPIPQLFINTGSPFLELNTNINQNGNSSSEETNQKKFINPMITVNELDFIYHQTSWFNQTCLKLWNNLIDNLSYLHLETATLLQQLHNLAEDSSVCEGIICTSMISPDESIAYEARKKFSILYNITRDLKVKSMPQAMMREFDRPLFFMLDNLTHKVNTFNAQAIDWLNQSLKNGDIARILEPILFIILHPDTSRVSVQRVNIHQPGLNENNNLIMNNAKKSDEADNASISASESKIYAISSTGGNVIYHVNADGRKRFSPSPNFSSNKVLTLTTQNLTNSGTRNGNKWTTSKFNLPDYEVPSSHERNSSEKYLPINMFLNPFGSMSSLNSDALEVYNETSSLSFTRSWPNLSSIKRFDGKSIKSEEIGKTPTPSSTPIPSRATTSCSTPIILKKQYDDSDLSDSEIIFNLIEEMIDKVVDDLDESESKSSESEESQTSSSKHTAITNSETISISSSKPVSMNQMHSHILLYQQVYDSKRTLYALSTLWDIILTEPQKVLFNMATTSISNRLGSRSQELQNICARHRNSLLGQGYYGELSSESITSFRSSSFLEVIVSTCIQFMTGFYPSLPQTRLNEDEILGNQKVRILSCEILRLIFDQLVVAVKGKPTFSTYLHDMLMRCKIQKTVLQCLVSSVSNFQLSKEIGINCEFAETIIDFNEKLWCQSCSGFQEDFQKALLTLLENLIILEHKVAPSNMTSDKEVPTHNRKGSDSRAAKIRFQPQMSSLKYYPNMLIPAQSMFLSSIQTALQQHHKVHLHANWLSLVESTLPYAGKSLSRLVICVLNQLCANLEACANVIENKGDKLAMTPNYINVLLKNVATLCHYCLLDTGNSNSPNSSLPNSPQNGSTNLLSANPFATANPFQMISTILHVFTPSDSNQDLSIAGRENNPNDPLVSTRKSVLNHLPRILTALLTIWKAIHNYEKNHELERENFGWEIMGTSREVKQNILSLLSPISLVHGSNFMSSVSVIWHDLRSKHTSKKLIIPPCSEDQQLLVELVAAIRVLPMESVLQTMRQALKQPTNPTNKHLKRPPVEVCMLQFFLVYIKASPGSQLLECWKSVLQLLKDGLQISSTAQPSVQFHLLAILHEFVQAAPLIEDRKDQKDLQDVAQKLVDACTTIAGARLGQTKWLRRNLEVIPGPQSDTIEDEDINDQTYNNNYYANNSFESINISDNDNSFLSKFSVQALCALAEFVAPVLDVVYVSEEKEKVVPLVTNIMYYVTPYLKNHSKQNAPSFRACSHLLSSMSGYQYTRKAWRKDAFELLLDPSFFQINSECFNHWKIIVDHLMTHDKTTFRDFLSKMSVNKSGSLQIFSSKDQEVEQRANLVKRLAFILFCSERDQYQKYMTEIQEKLIESLRLASSPLVQSQVLLCFRVIILRMSSQHLTSLWPFIYTEMFQVFLHIEMELMTDTPEFRKNNSSHIQRLANLDSSWVTSQSNGLAAHNNPSWMQLYLEACKLLDLAIALPADSLPQFQMYRWAFVGGDSTNSINGMNKSALHPTSLNSSPSQSPFEPHVVRIDNLMNAKNNNIDTLAYKPKCPLLTKPFIKNLLELHPFFHTILNVSQETNHLNEIHDQLNIGSDLITMDEAMNFIDKIVEVDFLEPIPID